VGEERKEFGGSASDKTREEKKINTQRKNNKSRKIGNTTRKKALTLGRVWLPLNGST
jgi:hypothetical protein